jgi:hypothetical protein
MSLISMAFHTRRVRLTPASSFLVACTFLACSESWCYGQGTSAAVLGQVIDPSAAIVFHAKVAVTETAARPGRLSRMTRDAIELTD